MPTHDLTKRLWGHDYAVREVQEEGRLIRLVGWYPGRIAQEDYLILAGDRPCTTTRYQVKSVDYPGDPRDMFFAVAHFAPR